MSTVTHSFLFSLLFFLLLSAPATVFSARCNPSDKKVLLQIMKSLHTSHVILEDLPPPGAGCCGYYGVHCDESTGRVTVLDISNDDRVANQIPPSIGDLPYLKTLILHKLPNLTGPIPHEIGRLPKLETLWLSWNGLSGPIPAIIGTLANLDYINLSFNKLSGTIPASLGNLTLLQSLFLDRNRLEGNIPESLGRLPQPELYVRLSHNNLTGQIPRSFGVLPFALVDLSRNALTGDASFMFGASKTTSGIDLSRNALEFDLSAVEFPLSLGSLHLEHNKIYGKIPAQITKLPLYNLNISYNRLCGEIPSDGSMGKFDEYSFFHNRCLCGSPLRPCK